MAGAKKHVMSVSVERLDPADGSFRCQMCGKGHGAGAYLVRIELPLHAMSVQGSKELRLGLNCARNFLHVSENGIKIWANLRSPVKIG